jgi:GT2 family glycosyltransferase
MDLSIIIVNWNSKEYLSRCIASIGASTGALEFESVVIDNASFDGCDKMLQQRHPGVRFIQADRNLGFAGACNAGFKISNGRHILFLNPDTEPEGTAIETLHRELDSIPDAGIVGPTLLNGDRSVQTSCIQSFPTILNQALDSDALRSLFPRARLWGMRPLFARQVVPVEVEAVSGACLMIKRSVFERVGMFKSDYFMYSEDMDLCYSVLNAGWKTYYVPRAAVVHHGGGSSVKGDGSKVHSMMMVESRWRFFRMTRSEGYSWAYRVMMFITAVMRIGVIVALWPALAMRKRGSSLEATLRKWTAIMRWTVEGESWVRNHKM